MIRWLALTNYVDVGRQTVDVGVYRPSFDGGVGVIRALGESLGGGAENQEIYVRVGYNSMLRTPRSLTKTPK